MPNYGTNCKGCSGEDCVCCSIFLEAQADQRAQRDEPEEIGSDWEPDEHLGEYEDDEVQDEPQEQQEEPE